MKFIVLLIFLLCYSLLGAQTRGVKTGKKTKNVCQLLSANPPAFQPFAYVPTEVKDKRFKNRLPKISFVVGEDGKVSEVKVVKGTGSPIVDAELVKSVATWKYKPQSGCMITMLMAVNIDIK